MNPISVETLSNAPELTIDPEFLITVSHRTHNAIHYGDESLLEKVHVDRSPNDTKLW